MLVQEGERVTKGQPLIRLGDASDTNYAAAQLELVSVQQAIIDRKDAQEAYGKAEDYLTYLQNSTKVPQTETRSFLIQIWKGYEYRYKTKNFKGAAPRIGSSKLRTTCPSKRRRWTKPSAPMTD